jgi:hypothetical protein
LRVQTFKQVKGKGALGRTADTSVSRHQGQRSGTMLFYNPGKFCGDFAEGLIPGNFFKRSADPFKRMIKAVGVVLIKFDVQPFAAGIPLAEPVVFIPANLYDFIVFDSNLEPALIAS